MNEEFVRKTLEEFDKSGIENIVVRKNEDDQYVISISYKEKTENKNGCEINYNGLKMNTKEKADWAIKTMKTDFGDKMIDFILGVEEFLENNNDKLKDLNEMMEEEYTTESILIAKFIMDGLNSQLGSKTVSRGIKAEEWFVVKNSKMPSVLVELGFLTNYEEACNLNDTAYLQKSALGIYNGISAFVTHFERSRGFTGTK